MDLLYIGNNAPPRSHRLSNREPSVKPKAIPLEFLVPSVMETHQTIQAIANDPVYPL